MGKIKAKFTENKKTFPNIIKFGLVTILLIEENKEEDLSQANDFSGFAIFPLDGHSEEQV